MGLGLGREAIREIRVIRGQNPLLAETSASLSVHLRLTPRKFQLRGSVGGFV
jgi:hypothetical protein